MDIESTRSPQWRARMTSGTTDIPTTSAPRMRNARISAGVSNDGPRHAMYTPSWIGIPASAAASLSSSRRSLSYALYIEGKRTPMGSFGPMSGFRAWKLM
eukprot:Amastigsp_a175219_632.p4 type:complete len:100 gc:universal Amastigsp_a175219_632:797-498(-)